jgi:hypothetical protein
MRSGFARARLVGCLLAAAAAHGALLVPWGLPWARRERPDVGAQTAIAGRDRATALESPSDRRARVLARAQAEVAAGQPSLGEHLVRLGHIDLEERGEGTQDELDQALATYAGLLAQVRARRAAGAPLPEAIADAVREDGRVGRYKRIHAHLAAALAKGGGNCVALSTLASALAADAAGIDHAALRVYANHVTPDVDGFRFGMASRCRGPGARVPATALLDAYALARQSGLSEPFALPRSDAACDDPGDVFGGVQLARTDAPPLPIGAPRATPSEKDADCRRWPLMEELDGDVEILGPDGRSLGGVSVARAGGLDLPGHAASAACFERRLDALPDGAPERDAPRFVLALADVALATEEAARVFAVGGELDVAREYDRRLAAVRSRAEAPLERVLAELEQQGAAQLVEGTEPPSIVANAGRLLALGERGRAVMVVALQKHRGYWELASLLMRPAAMPAALRAWRGKPRDVQVDVVSMLPCGSAVFAAQLEASDAPEAASLRAACRTRLRAEAGPCDVDLAGQGPDAPLLEAVARAQRRVRCPARNP